MECVNGCLENGYGEHTLNCELGAFGDFRDEHIGKLATDADAEREFACNTGGRSMFL